MPYLSHVVYINDTLWTVSAQRISVTQSAIISFSPCPQGPVLSTELKRNKRFDELISRLALFN